MSWKRLKLKVAVARAVGPGLFEAKKQGVALRGQCKGQAGGDEFDLSEESSKLAVLQKDYYGDHSLMYMCENPSVTAKKLDQLLGVKGGVELARQRRTEGDYPFHYLCRNSKVTAEVLKAFLKRVPDAAKWRGKWGMLPLHVLCCNRHMTGEAVHVLIRAFPGGVDYADALKLYPIHYLCSLLEDMSDPLQAFLKLSPHAAVDHLNTVGHRALDLLARNKYAPVEAYEALLVNCPQALDALRQDQERGLACPTIERVRDMLALMDRRSGQSKKKARTARLQKGPDQHVNHDLSQREKKTAWHGDSKIKRLGVTDPKKTESSVTDVKLPLIEERFISPVKAAKVPKQPQGLPYQAKKRHKKKHR